jgi:hypothetical protein
MICYNVLHIWQWYVTWIITIAVKLLFEPLCHNTGKPSVTAGWADLDTVLACYRQKHFLWNIFLAGLFTEIITANCRLCYRWRRAYASFSGHGKKQMLHFASNRRYLSEPERVTPLLLTSRHFTGSRHSKFMPSNKFIYTCAATWFCNTWPAGCMRPMLPRKAICP